MKNHYFPVIIAGLSAKEGKTLITTSLRRSSLFTFPQSPFSAGAAANSFYPNHQ